MEPLNNGHNGGKDFVLCREVVLFQRLKNTTTISLAPRNVSIIKRLSFFWRVLYQRFHCTPFSINDGPHPPLYRCDAYPPLASS